MKLDDRVRAGVDDWNELFLEHGAELLTLARTWLATPKDRALAIQIVAGSLFEEEHENPEAVTWLSGAGLDATPLVAPLVAAIASEPSSVKALFALARHGVDVSAAAEAVVPLLDKGTDKAQRAAAFAVLVHALCRGGKAAEVLPHLKGNAPFKSILFDELATSAARGWDIGPFLALAVKDLQAKGNETVRKAVDVLWGLAAAGVDIAAALPILEERQVALSGFTNSSQVIAAALLRMGDRDRLAAWIGSADRKQQLCAYRGLRIAWKQGVPAGIVFDDAALRGALEALAADPANRLPGLDE